MLYLQFYLDEYRYVLPTSDVVEIIPEIKLTPVPKVPEYIKGIVNYRGQSVPVIDLSSLYLDRPCSNKLSSRIILIMVNDNKGKDQIIGLLVEKATETIKVKKESFMESGIHSSDAPCLGPVISDERSFITLISPQEIFCHIDSGLIFP